MTPAVANPATRLLVEQSGKGESAQVLLRSKLRAVSRRMGFSEATRERMELVCNEVLTNQNKFAQGRGAVQIWETGEPHAALDVFAIDYGPGMVDIAQAARDGYTTAGTLGKGLGAIRRLSSLSEFYSIPIERRDTPWHGTAVWARFHQDGAPQAAQHEIGCYLRAYQDSPYSGDLVRVRVDGRLTRWLHVDALGHGREAAEVAAGIGDVLHDDAPPAVTVERLNTLLQGGRGAVAAVSQADAAEDSVDFCGVGDLGGYVIHDGERHPLTFAAGILGHAHRHLEPARLSLCPPALMITASDGLRRDWTLRSFPDLWRLHPQMIALLLGQVMGRHNDDRSVFVIRSAQTKRGQP